MARADKSRRASMKPSEAESGGALGFPTGSTVEIIEAEYTTWGEFGEKAIKRGRKADDPVLKIVGEVEGKDDAVTVGLGCGKSERLEPSDDGQFLNISEGSAAKAMNNQCNAFVFIDSIFYKDKKSEAYKRHGKMAIHEDKLDDGITDALVGLKFVAGSIVVKREFNDTEEEGKERKGGAAPSLVADQILEVPGEGGGGRSTSRSSSKKKDEEEEEERPARRRAVKEEDEDERPARRGKKDEEEEEEAADDDEAAEKAVLEVLELPKYRKGLPFDKAFPAVFNITKTQKNSKAIGELVEDRNWMTKKARPWTVDDEDLIQAE